ncbi:unnamed protein product, partial [Prorocentrum cordatum]
AQHLGRPAPDEPVVAVAQGIRQPSPAGLRGAGRSSDRLPTPSSCAGSTRTPTPQDTSEGWRHQQAVAAPPPPARAASGAAAPHHSSGPQVGRQAAQAWAQPRAIGPHGRGPGAAAPALPPPPARLPVARGH